MRGSRPLRPAKCFSDRLWKAVEKCWMEPKYRHTAKTFINCYPHEVHALEQEPPTLHLSAQTFNLRPESPLSQLALSDELANHYLNTVAGLQYLFVDKLTLSKILFDTVKKEGSARQAACLLALVHVQRGRAPRQAALRTSPIREIYRELLNMFSPTKQQFDEDDAFAALIVISVFIFDGGYGDWQKWLRVASTYSNCVLENRTRFYDYHDAIINCSDKERFIIKTTFWYDVIASVTTMSAPYFADIIDSLYNPANQSVASEESLLSMLPITGCENRIVWALSKTSQLYVWRQSRGKEGRLSILELNRRVADIAASLAPPNPPPPVSRTDVDVPQILASEVFRTSVIVYLINGDHPLIPAISKAVANAVSSLELIVSSASAPVRQVVMRSTVFAFFICTFLTTRRNKRSFLIEQLEDNGQVRSYRGVFKLLQGMNLGRTMPRPIPWRTMLHESKMLLV